MQGDDNESAPPLVDPPEEFTAKMSSADELSNMFRRPMRSLKGLPSSLLLEGASPSAAAVQMISLLHREILGPTFGAKEGMYGACGGGVHVLYVGRPSSPDPNLEEILNMLSMNEDFRNLKWMITVDPLHQYMFPKTAEEAEDCAGEENVLSLDTFAGFLDRMRTKPIASGGDIPEYVRLRYPFLANGRVLFLLPLFEGMHDGTCLEAGYCPVAEAFQAASAANPQLLWSNFQERDGMNGLVAIEQSSGEPCLAGDVNQSPVLALFQLAETNELMALAQWDYRD